MTIHERTKRFDKVRTETIIGAGASVVMSMDEHGAVVDRLNIVDADTVVRHTSHFPVSEVIDERVLRGQEINDAHLVIHPVGILSTHEIVWTPSAVA